MYILAAPIARDVLKPKLYKILSYACRHLLRKISKVYTAKIKLRIAANTSYRISKFSAKKSDNSSLLRTLGVGSVSRKHFCSKWSFRAIPKEKKTSAILKDTENYFYTKLFCSHIVMIVLSLHSFRISKSWIWTPWFEAAIDLAQNEHDWNGQPSEVSRQKIGEISKHRKLIHVYFVFHAFVVFNFSCK